MIILQTCNLKGINLLQNTERQLHVLNQSFQLAPQTQNICAMSTKYLTQYLWNITENVY